MYQPDIAAAALVAALVAAAADWKATGWVESAV